MRNVDELNGTDLDYWVARACGYTVKARASDFPNRLSYATSADSEVWYWLSMFTPSKEWSQAGPIIERANIQLGPPTQSVHRNGGPNSGWGASGMWSACTWHKGVNGRRAISHDKESALVAAMRCYVKSKFGDEVDDSKDAP
jgi:hypothetical protein